MAGKPNMKKYAKEAVKLGAQDAKLILTRTIVAAPWVRIKCQYGCSGYGQCLTCPPYSPTPETTTKILENFRKALLIHGDNHTDVTSIAATIERIAFLDGYYKAFAIGSGPCRLCDTCNLKHKECRHPEEARPSMEACGIDVYQTVRNNSYPIEVVKNHSGKQNYYSMILIE